MSVGRLGSPTRYKTCLDYRSVRGWISYTLLLLNTQLLLNLVYGGDTLRSLTDASFIFGANAELQLLTLLHRNSGRKEDKCILMKNRAL